MSNNKKSLRTKMKNMGKPLRIRKVQSTSLKNRLLRQLVQIICIKSLKICIHFLSESQQDSPVAQSLLKVHDFRRSHVVRRERRPSYMESPKTERPKQTFIPQTEDSNVTSALETSNQYAIFTEANTNSQRQQMPTKS